MGGTSKIPNALEKFFLTEYSNISGKKNCLLGVQSSGNLAMIAMGKG